MPELFIKEICLGKFQIILEDMKSADSKQKNVTIICPAYKNKSKPYTFTHDPKFMNLFDT